jgi:cytochrome c553
VKKPSKETVKREGKRVVWVLLGLGAGALLAALAGLIPMRASSGHMPLTEWLLETTMRRSVATRSAGVPSVPLDDPGLVLKGAGHYAQGCEPCHGGPGRGQPEYVRHMTPHPPRLDGKAGEVTTYERDDLFYVVRHGVKFTGMPAWPSEHRDDEVWAVVAFLLTLPGMTAEEYAQLAAVGDAAPSGTGVLAICARCHGTDGRGRGLGAFPRLAGQSPEYLYRALVAFAEGERESGIMAMAVAGLDRETLRGLARYYAALEATPSRGPKGDAALVARGEAIASFGVAERRIPSCADCHGPGQAGSPRNPAYPRIAGLHPSYLTLQLHLFRKGDRGGSAYAHLMEKAVENLEDDEIAAVAVYYGSLAPDLH